MHYAELPLPPELDGLVAAVWTIAGEGSADDWIEQDATPDGCIEIIHRKVGRSFWGAEQPAYFVTGLNQAAIRFRISGDAVFTGIRLWPWAWAMLGLELCPTFADSWIAVSPNHPLEALAADPDRIAPKLAALFATLPRGPIGAHVLAADSVGGLVRATGVSYRGLQRWFERVVGMPPRRYLRLIRFRKTMADLAQPASTLADHAARSGFADQAHMARDFRVLAGVAPRAARTRAQGPFLTDTH